MARAEVENGRLHKYLSAIVLFWWQELQQPSWTMRMRITSGTAVPRAETSLGFRTQNVVELWQDSSYGQPTASGFDFLVFEPMLFCNLELTYFFLAAFICLCPPTLLALHKPTNSMLICSFPLVLTLLELPVLHLPVKLPVHVCYITKSLHRYFSQ